MRRWLVAAVAAGALHASVIRGVAVEDQSGRPLARTLVVIQPVAGSQASPASVRSNNYGAFEFAGLPAGAYIVSASRRGFAPLAYGQKRWKGAGVPVTVEDGGSIALSLRLKRFGAIAGTIADENDVGIPEHDVAVYRNTRPPELVTRAKTDDRGAYRIWGLEPGWYLVRTLARQFEESGYLPTWSKETGRLDEARPVEVKLDQESDFSNVRPLQGRLFTVAGVAQTYPPTTVTLTLVSDAGTETTVSDSSGLFKFNPVAPGSYELMANASDRRTGAMIAGYIPVNVDRDRTDYRVPLAALPELQVAVEDTAGKPIALETVTILARRRDLAGYGKPETLRMPRGRIALLPGRWDLTLATASSQYVASFSVSGGDNASRGRADGWNEVVMQGPVAVKFVISSNPGAVHGTVVTSGQPAAGASVLLEAYDAASRRRLTDLRTARTDIRGQYQFYGLAPGRYRVVSTFEFQSPDAAELDAANPKTVTIEEGKDAAMDLELYVIR